MSKGKILMLPLDERPCNYHYPWMMPKTDFELILPPEDIMSRKKTAADTEKIADWLRKNAIECDALVVSLDMLIYGGIVPSRLHHDAVDDLIKKAEILKEIRRLKPEIKIYAFELIMRCPSYSSSDEEPDYYDECGEEIFLYGRYTHLEKIGKLTEQDKEDFRRVKSKIKEEYLTDFINRRKTNLAVLMHNLNFVLDGTVDYFIVPQDDASVYGFTSMDQLTVREFLKTNILHRKTAMYPSADDTGLTLLARAVAQLSGERTKVYVHYSSVKGEFCVPEVEDRIVGETVKYHILSVDGIQVYSIAEADIVLAVNVGSGMMQPDKPDFVTAYDIERNLAEFVNFIDYAIELGKVVAVADIAHINRADTEFTELMYRENLLLKIHGYAGWNTSSNTIGTTLCEALLYNIGKDKEGNTNFLLHRYYEDIGYMAYTRQYVIKNILPSMGLNYRKIDGADGKVAQIVKETVLQYMEEHYPKIAEQVSEITVKMPWDRTFETDIKIK